DGIGRAHLEGLLQAGDDVSGGERGTRVGLEPLRRIELGLRHGSGQDQRRDEKSQPDAHGSLLEWHCYLWGVGVGGGGRWRSCCRMSTGSPFFPSPPSRTPPRILPAEP